MQWQCTGVQETGVRIYYFSTLLWTRLVNIMASHIFMRI